MISVLDNFVVDDQNEDLFFVLHMEKIGHLPRLPLMRLIYFKPGIFSMPERVDSYAFCREVNSKTFNPILLIFLFRLR